MLNIEIDVTEGQKKVDDLDKKILGLGESAKKASDSFSKNLSFSDAARREFASVIKEVNSLSAAVRDVRKELKSSGLGFRDLVTMQGDLRQNAAAVSKTIVTQAKSLRDASTSTKALTKDTAALSAETRKYAELESAALKVKRQTEDYNQRLLRVGKQLKKMHEEGLITVRQYTRALEMERKAAEASGTEAEKMLRKLTQQNSQFLKSAQDLAKNANGWKLMTDAQKNALDTQVRVNEAIKNQSGLFKESLSATDKYKRSIQDLNLLKKEGIISEDQYKSALRAALKEMNETVTTQIRMNAAKAKTAQAVKVERTEVEAYVASLLRQNGEFAKTQIELLRQKEGWDKLTDAQRRAAEQAVKTGEAMRVAGSLVKPVETPTSTYTNQRAALGTLFQQGNINAQQYATGVAAANKQLYENSLAALKAESANKRLTDRFHLANQAGAAFRASLQGANVGFGIFTTQTIAAATAAYAFTKALKTSISVGAEFERTFERAAVMMGEYDRKANGGLGGMSQQAEAIQSRVLQLAKDTQFSANEVATAVRELAQAGQSPIEIYNSLSGVLDIATIGFVDIGEAAKISANILAEYGLQAGDLDSVVDKMAKAISISTIELKDLANTLSYAGPIAHALGIGLDETAAATALLGQAGIKGSRAGTTLRGIMSNLAELTPKAAAAFEKLGINYKDLTKDGVSLEKIFGELSKKMKGLTDQQKVALTEDIVGRWAVSGALALVNFSDTTGETASMFGKYMDQIKNKSAGAGSEMRKSLQQNFQMAFENLQSTMETVAIRAFNAFGPQLTAKIQQLAKFIEDHGNEISNTIAQLALKFISFAEVIVKYSDLIVKALAWYTAFRIIRSVGVEMTNMAAMVSTALRAKQTVMAQDRAATAVWTATMTQSGQVISSSWGAAGVATAANASKVGAGAKAAAGAMNLLKAAGGGLMAMFGGPWGLALAAAVAAIYLLDAALTSTKITASNTSGALDQFRAFSKDLGAISKDNRLDLFKNLNADIEIHIQKIKEIRKEYGELINDQKAISRGEASANYLKEHGYNTEGFGLQDVGALLQQSGKYGGMSSPMGGMNFWAVVAMKAMSKEGAQAKEATAALARELDNLTQSEIARKRLVGENPFEGVISFLNNYKDSIDSIISSITLLDQALNGSKLFDILGFDLSGLRQGIDNFRRGYVEGPPAGLVGPPRKDGSFFTPPVDLDESNEALKEAKAIASEYANELKSIVQEYEKQKGSIEEVKRGLSRVTEIQNELKNASSATSKEMQKLGYSAKEIKDALDWKSKELVMSGLDQILESMDSRFASLHAEVEKTNKATGSFGDIATNAMAKVRETLDTLLDSKAISPELYNEILEFYAVNVPKAVDGSLSAIKRLDDFIRSTNESWAQFISSDSLEGMARSFKKTYDQMSDGERLALAQAKIMKELGDGFSAVSSESERFSEFQKAMNELLKQGAISAEQAARATKKFYDSLPTGKLEKENQHLMTQIALMKQGKGAVDLYNMAWEATGGTLEDLSPKFYEVAKANQALQEELKQIQEVQGAFQTFGDGVARMFTDLFTGGIKNMKDFGQRIKDLFKQLLADLLYMAIRNGIMKALFGQGQGNTQGFWDSILSGFTNLFSGGGGNGGGFWSSIASAFVGGFGGSSSSGGGGGGGMDWTSVVGSVVNNTAGGGTSGGGSGGGGGFDVTSMMNPASWGNYTRMWNNFTNPSYWSNMGSSFFGSPMMGGGGMVMNSPMAVGAGTPGPWANGYVYSGTNTGYMTMPSYTGSTTTGTMGGLPAGYTTGALIGGIAGGLTGLYAGSRAGDGGMGTVGSTVAYGLGGATIGATLGAAAATGTFAGTGAAIGTAATSMGASAGFAAAIPIVGWIAALAMIVDAYSGGKIFGSKWKTDNISTNMQFGPEGATVTNTNNQWRYRSQLSQAWGRVSTGGAILPSDWGDKYHRSVNLAVTPEQIEEANKVFANLKKTYAASAKALGIEMANVLSTSFETITYYTKKGKIDTKRPAKTISTVRGVKYEEDFEAYQKRIHAEAMIESINKSIRESFANNKEPLTAAQADEANKLAERWRKDADKFLEGAAFLLQAQVDLVHGVGLMEENFPGALTATLKLVEDLAKGEESLEETYQRLKASVALVDQTLNFFGASMGRTREEYITFSAELVNALGGLDTAAQKLGRFMEAFGNIPEISQARGDKAYADRGKLLDKIGLAADTTAEEFIAAFQEAMDKGLTPEETANWINAGEALANISLGLEALRKQAEGTGDSLLDQVNKSIDALRQMGASEQELAQAREYGQQILAKALSDYMYQVEAQLATFEGREYVQKLKDINRSVIEAIRQAKELGATEQDLARIRQLAAFQTAEVMSQLLASVGSLVDELYGDNAESLALEQSQYEARQQAAQDLHDQEMQRYHDAQEAIKRIKEFLDDLEIGTLSPGSWQDRLGAAETQFNDLLRRAMAGDSDALSQITQAAQDYLSLGQEFYGSTSSYGNIYQYVTEALRALQTRLGTVTSPGGSVEGGTGASPAEVAQRERTEEETRQRRYDAALKLAQQLGQLSIITNTSIADLLKEYDITLKDLATDLGIDLKKIDETTGTKLKMLAASLGIGVDEITTELGMTTQQIRDAFKLNIDDIVDGNATGLRQLADSLGTDIWGAMEYLGYDLAEVAKSFGIDINNLTADMVPKLGEMAKALGVSSLVLAEKLDIDLSDLANEFGYQVGLHTDENFRNLVDFSRAIGANTLDVANKFGEGIPWLAEQIGTNVLNSLNASSLPQSTKDALKPFLEAIQASANTSQLNSAFSTLNAYIDTLPADQALAVRQWFTDLGIDLKGPEGSSLTDVKRTAKATEDAAKSLWGGLYYDNTMPLLMLVDTTLVELLNSLIGAERLPVLVEMANGANSFTSTLASVSSTADALASSAYTTISDMYDMYENYADSVYTGSEQAKSPEEKAEQAAQTQAEIQRAANDKLDVLTEHVAVLTEVLHDKLSQVNEAQIGTKEEVKNLKKEVKSKGPVATSKRLK